MKCRNCGAELIPGVKFCKECGAKVEAQKRFCRECGAELVDGMKFCSNCGAKVNFLEDMEVEKGIPEIPKDNTSNNESSENNKEQVNSDIKDQTKVSSFSDILNTIKSVSQSINTQPKNDKIQKAVIEKWNTFDIFSKIIIVILIASLLQLLFAIISGKESSILISILQIILLIVTYLIHKNIIKTQNKQNKLKYVLLAWVVLSMVLNIMSFSSGKNDSKVTNSENETTEKSEEKKSETKTNYKITKGSQYAYMSDEWNVYIAEAISDSIIKIEHWDKTMSNTKDMSYSEDIGTYKINDSENGFKWVDDEHTAFTFNFEDKNNSRVKQSDSHTFTINIDDKDECKGTDYNEEIACYSYTNDGWHMYRAIPLSNHLIKMECWYRSNKIGDFLFGWDWCVIDTDKTDTDFEWTDDEHTSFTITTKDPQNDYYWKNEEYVLFELENKDYKYPNVVSYLNLQSVSEDEIKVPKDAGDYFYEDYKNVQKSLSEAGFTNIKTKILYDIVLGLTDEGAVESVSINGDDSFNKGDVFKKDAEVVITYHMSEEDDPSKQEEDESTETKESEETTKTDSESVSYSTNSKDTVKNGNSGVYAYKKSGSYDIYYIINFDEGYVYWFTDGDGDESCDRVKIDSGTLNDVVIITYHDGEDSWQNGLHFKYKNVPDHLIMEDNDHFEYDFSTTNLNDALKIRDSKTIHDY